jgi:hypothetical protein
VSYPRSLRARRAAPPDIENDDSVAVGVAPEPFPVPGLDLPTPFDLIGAGRRALAGVAAPVRTSRLALPVAIAIASRVYSILLLSLIPLLQPVLAIPRLTGFRSPILQWDSQWYLTIANYGYHAAAMQPGPFGGRHDFAFFPAWPMLLRQIQTLGIPASDAAVPLANLLFIAASIPIYIVLDRLFGRTAALGGLALLAFSPPAYVLSMPYSEPLFLLLVGALFATRSGALRAALGVAVGVTRITGVAVAIASGVRWLRDRRDWRPLLTSIAIAIAFAGWWVFIWQLTGDPLGWFQGSAQWGRLLGPSAIIWSIEVGSSARIGALLFVGLLLGASILVARRDLELGIYCVLAILLSLAGAPVESMPRHALVAFPAFGLIASRLGARRTIVLALILAGFQLNDVLLAFVGPMPLAP